MQQELDLFSRLDARGRPASRRSDPWTSHAAGEAATEPAPVSVGRLAALAALSLRAMTDFELAAETGRQQTSIGKRRLDCLRSGWVAPALGLDGKQRTRPTPSGASSLVWQITPAGRAVLASVDRD